MTSDPWRYRCPEGHTDVVARVQTVQNDTGTYYKCRSCDREYDALIDVKTGREVQSRG